MRGLRQLIASPMRPSSTVGNPFVSFVQVWPRIGRLVEAALGPTANQLSDRAPALIGGGVKDVGILRIHRDFGDAGVGADREHRFPRLAAVGGLVQPAVAARRPQRPDRADVDNVRVAGIDEDVLNVLGVLEPHPLPRLARVGGLVDAVAEGDAPLVVVLAGAEPDDVRVLRVDGHRAERIGAVLVEDRRPGIAAVLGLPQIARGRSDVPDAGILRVDGDIRDAAGRQARSEAAEGDWFHRLGSQRRGARLGGEGGGGEGAGSEQQRARRNVRASHD